MIKVSILYPNSPDAKFDFDYYLTTHMELVRSRLGPMGMIGDEVMKGVGSGAPGEPAPFTTICHLFFNSEEEVHKAFGAHAKEVMGDIPNYTNIKPQIQISEVLS